MGYLLFGTINSKIINAIWPPELEVQYSRLYPEIQMTVHNMLKGIIIITPHVHDGDDDDMMREREDD
jgi:hypothetical protein